MGSCQWIDIPHGLDMLRTFPCRFAASLVATVSIFTLAMPFAQARELAVEPDEFVEVEIATVGVSPFGSPVILLREPEAREVIPIFIGTAEAKSILRALRGLEPQRPMTHDLLGKVYGAFDARLVRVYVDDLRDDIFFGMLEFEVEGHDEPLRIDSRPSDALALALRAGATIHVAPKVREAARRIEYEGLENEVVSAIGLTVSPVTPELREALELPDRDGVLVTDSRAAAAEAGIVPGALIVTVNGEVPTTPWRFLELVRDTAEDENARIVYWQEGEEHEIELPTDVPDPEPRDPEEDEGITL